METAHPDTVEVTFPGPAPSIGRVVAGGFCVGCGACAVASPIITMKRGATGEIRAVLDDVQPERLVEATGVCPFADESTNEDVLAARLFPEAPKQDPLIGRYIGLHAGRVADEQQIVDSSSGGLTHWMAETLLRSGSVDGVVHLGHGDGPASDMFRFGVSRSVEALLAARKSKYYGADFADAVRSIRGDGKRYAFIGVPCYVKAMRLLCASDDTLREQFPFMLALVCGHLKSAAYAELLAWQAGVAPDALATVDFRVKARGAKTSDYRFSAVDTGGQTHTARAHDLLGANWGHAMMQLKACDFCDDIFGECADAAFGDAWLFRYEHDWRGTNVVVTRNPMLEGLLLRASGRSIMLEDLSAEDAIATQAGNVRHRRDGLSVRLEQASQRGEWAPTKRVAAGSRTVTPQRRKIVELRQQIACLSHDAFAEARRQGDLKLFARRMTPLMRRMQSLTRPPLLTRTYQRISHFVRHPLGR